MSIILDGTAGISTPDLESAGPISGTTGSFSGNVLLGSSVLATPAGSAPSYTCRAWVNFNGTGTVAIRGSGNVSSVSDLGVGDYTVNFTTAMPDANYSLAGLCRGQNDGDSNSTITGSGVLTTTTAKVHTKNSSNSAVDTTAVNVVIFR